MTLLGRVRMPSLDGATGWLGAGAAGRADLRGHVVLVNFWTLTCINWLRQEPHVRAWSRAYRDDGLVVVGVHTPEFSFEHDVDRVRRAVAERAIDYPVAIDNDYAVWGAFANRYWPALYFVDGDAVIRDQHFGEGRYERLERVIQQLLGIDREPVAVEGTGVEAEADWDHLRSPETYLGYQRGERFAAPGGAVLDASHDYEVPVRLGLNTWALGGEWTIGWEQATLARGPGRITFRFHARDAHIVLSRRSPDPIPFHVLVDGAPPGPSHGVDVGEDGSGILDDGRLYHLVRGRGPVAERTLELTLPDAGAEAYVLTFG